MKQIKWNIYNIYKNKYSLHSRLYDIWEEKDYFKICHFSKSTHINIIFKTILNQYLVRIIYSSYHLASEQEKKGTKQWWKSPPSTSTLQDPFQIQPSRWTLLLTTYLGGGIEVESLSEKVSTVMMIPVGGVVMAKWTSKGHHHD